MRWVAVSLVLIVWVTMDAPARADDWGARRDPFVLRDVAAYKAILAKNPHDPSAFTNLVAMYKGYRTVALLESEYKTQLGTTEDGATLVVLARLATAPAEATALWARATKARPTDPSAWLALGDHDLRVARDAYRKAVDLSATPVSKRAALVKLVSAAKRLNDTATVDGAYTELVAIAPKEGGVWLERGNAQLESKHYTEAVQSFATAESLFRTDPERRYEAMTSNGIALERAGRVDDAIAQYLATLDKLPTGYYLGRDLVVRIIDAERKRGRTPSAIELFEKRWPEAARGHFEWDTLGDLYKQIGVEDKALAAYKRAVAKAPTEVVTQRKLIALLDKWHPSDALAQHEAAARVAPGDADLQIALAKRYHPIDPKKALATLATLSQRMTGNVNVRRTIADLYAEWAQPALAIKEYEAIVVIEPNEPEHAILLGTVQWDAGNTDKARTAWQRLLKINTVEALKSLGEVLTSHDLWDDAIVAYTKLLAVDPLSTTALVGRATANEELKRYSEALDDAKRAVALVWRARREDGQRERFLLARVLANWDKAGTPVPLRRALARWKFAFARGELGAGYLLAAHDTRVASPEQHDVLVELYRRVPDDASLGIEVVRSFTRQKEFDRARDEALKIGHRVPARAKEIDELVARIESDRERYELDARWDEEGVPDYQRRNGTPDIIGRFRVGVRIGLGTDVKASGGDLFNIGISGSKHLGEGTAVDIRFEWAKRDDDMAPVESFEGAVGIARRIWDARAFEMGLVVAPRLEVRYDKLGPFDRVGLSGDATLTFMPRSLPATIDLRFHQLLTDSERRSALMLELAFEYR